MPSCAAAPEEIDIALALVRSRPNRAPGLAARTLNGADVVIATLLDIGVDTVFGYPGGAVLPLYDALHQESRLRHVLVRHEQRPCTPPRAMHARRAGSASSSSPPARV